MAGRVIVVRYKCNHRAYVPEGKDETENSRKVLEAERKYCPDCRASIDDHNTKAKANGRPALKEYDD
jgi:hypothetical protein